MSKIPRQRGKDMPVAFNGVNDGTHDFGYPCSMPRSVTIDGLFIDDQWTKDNPKPGVSLFGDPIGRSTEPRPFPYRLTERVSVRNLTTASGVFPALSTNDEVSRAIRLERR